MGYRNKIAILSKERHEIIKDMTHGQLVKWFQKNLSEAGALDEDDKYVPCYELAEELFDMGKYCELDVLNQFKRPIFSKVRTNNQFNDEGEFCIIGKEGLLEIIEDNRKKVVKYYELLVHPEKADKYFSETSESHLKAKLEEWGNNYCRPYCLDLERPAVVDSWSYEYTTFELVRILKTIDYEKYEVCLTGW